MAPVDKKRKGSNADGEAKAKKAKAVDDDDENMTSIEAARQAKARLAKLSAAKGKKKAVESDDDESTQEPAPKAKAKAKAPAKKAADSDDDDSDDEPAPKAKAKAKAKAAVEDDEEEPQKPAVRSSDEMTVFVGGLPFSCTEEQLRKDFGECGEIEKMNMPKNDEDKPRGIAFITFKTKEGVAAALKYDGDDYGGRTLKVNMAGQKSEKGKGDKGKSKGKGKDGKGDKGKGKGGKGGSNDELTVFVRGLPFSVDEASLRKDFAECGEIERISLPLNEEGKPKGIAFVQYKEKTGCEGAVKFDNTDYGGRTIFVRMAGDRGDKGDGKGKGKDGGKDGKGKGKDKGKGKGKKGKGKGDLSSEKKAAKDGAMVESTGVKQTFADSEDDDDAPPKKKAKKTVESSDDE